MQLAKRRIALLALSTAAACVLVTPTLYRLVRRAAERATHRAHCIADADPTTDETYLVYAPQNGLSNQFIALRDAVVYALMLNRTLVLPHLIGHGDANVHVARTVFGASLSHEQRERLEPLRVVEMHDFLRLGHRPPWIFRFRTRTTFKLEQHDYYALLGLRPYASDYSPVEVNIRDHRPRDVMHTFHTPMCRSQRVLAMSSLFGALQIADSTEYPPPGREWVNRVAIPMLLSPNAAVRNLVAAIRERIASVASGERGAAAAFTCAHLRRGDFSWACASLDAEAIGASPRDWVRSHHSKGLSCLQDADEIALNLRRPPNHQPIFLALEDPEILHEPVLAPFRVLALSNFTDLIRRAELPIPAQLLYPLLDQLICSHASTMLLNVYSTFSQMAMGHSGLRYGAHLGWKRSLTRSDQDRLGVEVLYWMRKRCFGGDGVVRKDVCGDG